MGRIQFEAIYPPGVRPNRYRPFVSPVPSSATAKRRRGKPSTVEVPAGAPPSAPVPVSPLPGDGAGVRATVTIELPKLIPLETIAQASGVSALALREAVARGQLAVAEVGATVYTSREEVLELLKLKRRAISE